MKVEKAVEIQRKLIVGTQKQHDAESDPSKKRALHERIQSCYVAIACMTCMEGTGIEDRIETAGISGAPPEAV